MGPTPENSRLGPPPRWLRCPRKGAVINNVFVPAKTPLCDLYDDLVAEQYRFPPKMLISSLEQQCKVGLWIDLTNTDRFYFRSEVEESNVRYVKIHLKGHGSCPSEEQTRAFIEICKDFMRDKPKHLIVIHCTHGFNRTGFLIAAYLVEHLDWSVDAAVAAFSAARPPGWQYSVFFETFCIYKEDYLRELYRRYEQDEGAAPPAPALPDWCNEVDPQLDDQEAESSASNASTSKQAAQFMDGAVPAVRLVTDGRVKEHVQRTVATMLEYRGKGFAGMQPVSMEMSPEKNNLVCLSQYPYKVSWKADGVRYLMLIEGENKIYMLDRDNRVFHVPHLSFRNRKELNKHLQNTLVDGEMVIDAHEGRNIPRFLIYDIVKFEGNPVGKCDFNKRIFCIQKELIEPRASAITKGLLDKSKEPFSVRWKEFFDVCPGPAQNNVEKFYSPAFTKQLTHEIDGLIFQPVGAPYKAGRDEFVLKWKPPEQATVDFKLCIEVTNRPGMLREKVGYLYVLHLDQPFAQMKVDKQLKQYDRRIIECHYEAGQWRFMRERTDKSHPNAFNTAKSVCQTINHPISKEKLIDYIRQHAAPPPNSANANSKRPAPPANGQPPPAKQPMPAPDYVPPHKTSA